MRILLVTAFFGVLFACGNETEEKCSFVPETKALDVNLVSLEDSLPAIRQKKELVDFFTRHPGARDLLFNRGAYPGDSAFINKLFSRFTNPHIDTLLMETHGIFGSGEELRAELGKAFGNIRFYYTDFEPPRVETFVTGLESDLYVSDSLVMIGLDYFLGSGARFRPNMYEYMLRRYDKNQIVPSVVLLTGIDSRYNKVDQADKTVLADMIAYGKAYYFAKQMLPCTPDSVLIGYTSKEISGAREFENLIWSRFVEDEVLFSTSHLVKQKYIAERPKTLEVGEECPGRIGTWVGWQIVRAYMRAHPSVTLPQLMETKDASQLFNDSGYRPQVVKVPSN